MAWQVIHDLQPIGELELGHRVLQTRLLKLFQLQLLGVVKNDTRGYPTISRHSHFKHTRAYQLSRAANAGSSTQHEFPISDTLALLASAVFDVARLAGGLTSPQAVYKIWYAACSLDALGSSFEHHAVLKKFSVI